MRSDRKRLFLLIAVAGALAVVFVVVHGVPALMGSGSDDETSARNVGRTSGSANGDGSPGPAPSEGGNVSGGPTVAVRRRDVVRIAIQRKPENLPHLKEAAADPDWRVRHAAVDGVGRLGRQGDPQFLIDVLRNPDELAEVRAAAAERLGEMRFWDAGPAIIEAMEGPSALLRARAGVALRRIMVVDFGYRASDPPNRRREAIQRIREWWPKFHEHFAGREKAEG
ncbi:MAG: hypothetical protein AMK72_02435 [Planctomycetes bacterium SM23_25]|nr:MAG: hypothetical protein AMK72_02435 [Planctomycetes bacterium SM23_25]